MKNKYEFTLVLLMALTLAGFIFTRIYTAMQQQQGEEKLVVVTSFYPMYIAALNVVGDNRNIELQNLSEPQTGCLHDYQLTPRDMMLLADADVFIINGGGIENFLTEVAQEYPDLVIVDASQGILSGENDRESEGQSALEHEGHDHGANTHVWMSMYHYEEQVAKIAEGLARADRANREDYQINARKYQEKIRNLIEAAEPLRQAAAGLPVVIFHEAYEYLAEDYGMEAAGILNLDEERQVSAGEVADVLRTIEEKNVQIVLAEEMYGKSMGDTIEAESSCRVYYLNTLVRGEYDADSWLKGMEQNISMLKEALCVE